LEALRKRAARILSLKEQLGILKPDTSPLFKVDKEKNKQISDAVVEQSITVIRDRNSRIPFSIHEDTRILHVTIMNDAEKHREMLEGLQNEIKAYTGQLDCWVDPGPDALFEAACHNRYDLIICSIGSELSYGLNVVRLHGRVARNMMQGWMKLDTPVIFVASPLHPPGIPGVRRYRYQYLRKYRPHSQMPDGGHHRQAGAVPNAACAQPLN
jgi:beta-N-acetylhexosaminidase